MKALAIADLHLSAKARDAYRFEVMALVATLLEKHKVDYLIILGDLTENKDFHPAPLVNDVVDIIHSFSQFCEVLVLRGNHDYTRDDFPFFRFLRRLKRVRWINTVSRIDLGKADCLFLPHTRDWEKDWAQFPHLAEIDWVFAHNTFEGATTEHGKKLNGIRTDIFDETTVISGDIHTPQTLGPVTYVGSPYTVDFGDDFEPRALLLHWFGPGDFKADSVLLPGPQKRLIEIETADIGKLRVGLGREFDADDIIKVRVKLTRDEQANWFTIRDKVKKELTELGVIVHLVQPLISEKAKGSVKIKKATTKKDDVVVREYGRAVKVPEETLKVGLEFLKEA